MLKKLFVSVFLCSSCLLFAQEQTEVLPSIQFDSQKIDIGEHPYVAGTTYRYDFVYENTGEVPLIVNRVTAGCPCVSITFSTDPLPPGQRDTVVVFFTPTHASRYSQRLTVFSNSDKPALTLFAKGTFLKPEGSKKKKVKE